MGWGQTLQVFASTHYLQAAGMRGGLGTGRNAPESDDLLCGLRVEPGLEPSLKKLNSRFVDQGVFFIPIPATPGTSLLLCACKDAKSLESCPTLCNPMECSPPDSSVHGILQARTLAWVALHQGIFPTQGSNLHLLCLLHWPASSLPLVPPGLIQSIKRL